MHSSFSSLPAPYRHEDAQRWREQWLELAQREQDASLAQWMREAAPEPLFEALAGNSPYLARLLLAYPAIARGFLAAGSGEAHRLALAILDEGSPDEDEASIRRRLRIAKGQLALMAALADIAGQWTLEQVTEALSGLAERCLAVSIDALLRAGEKRGDITLVNPTSPAEGSGVIVLGMGKLGGRELNYSSDIDLIILYEPGRLSYRGRHTEQQFMNRLAHDLVSFMQERDRAGYVFRTDLRLRPDPASTPPAVTTEAAHYYYESVGQNWERAAMIKARPVAGDIAAGERFLDSIAPFMWRRNLDFAAINDIHSIKRQMDSIHSKEITLGGHNIKLGRGGIREIEFYAQIHQLIWGGREPSLRTRATCDTLETLAGMGLIPSQTEAALRDAYAYLRKLEHRLQMIADEQTHSLPSSDDGIAHIAAFMGYDSTARFEDELIALLTRVHGIYAASFRGEAENLGEGGNLVFTGVSHDPETLQTLRAMGYANAETLSEIVMGWHHGSKRATRSQRARELLTELMPALLKRLSETANPDAAFLKFDEFLGRLPAGVQLFSLFSANPHLLGLIADIMGSAPALADALSKTPQLLDAVLYEDFYGPLPSPALLERQLDDMLRGVDDFEARLNTLRRFRNEKQFQAGVQLLKRMITAQAAGIFLSNLADGVIARTWESVEAEFAKSYGAIPGARFAVIALGKLGSRELTFGSDIDLVFVYDVTNADAVSTGDKKFTAGVYYARLCQRFLNALTAMGRDGRLYEVDTRLRPSGAQGPLAVSLTALTQYFEEQAWTFELMAYTKARALTSSAPFAEELERFICGQLARPRDEGKLKADVADMRERIEKEHGGDNPWDIKYARGGLMDIDFIAQYLMLLHAPRAPGARPGSAGEIFTWLAGSGRLPLKQADALLEAARFLGELFHMLRLCHERGLDGDNAPPGLKKLLAEAVRERDFESLKNRLIQIEQSVRGHYITFLQS